MKKLIIIYLLVTGISSLKGQDVTIIEQNENFSVSEKQEEFYYIEKDFPLTNDRWLATLDGFCTNTKKSNLEYLFYDFWKTSNTLGANAFFIDEFTYSPDTIFVTISVFNLTEEELDDNYALYSCNKIVIFGDLIASDFKTNAPKKQEVKVNKEKIKIYPLSYYEYQSDIGEKVNLSIGGFFGSGYTRMGEAGKVSVYLSLNGGTIRPVVRPMGGVGVNFSNGSFSLLDMNFGQFLVEVLEKSE
jgi:hypothetical protein